MKTCTNPRFCYSRQTRHSMKQRRLAAIAYVFIRNNDEISLRSRRNAVQVPQFHIINGHRLWFTQKDRSMRLRCAGNSPVATFVTAMNSSSPEDAANMFILPMIMPFMMFGCIMPMSFLSLIPRLVASVSLLNGRDFRYPVIGKWLENFLSDEGKALE